MARRIFALALLAGLTTASLAGCVFLGSSDEESAEPAPSETDRTEPSESDDTTPSAPMPTEPDPEAEGLEEWPLSIPQPPGSPVPGFDTPAFYMVSADRDTYLAYLAEIRDLRDSEEIHSSTQETDGAVFRIGEFDMIIVFTEEGGDSFISVMLS
ncbi:MAG TPA: hypothetical protein H9830_06255 [Candidatus Agrococcus pullicola]|uniref:Uncharacterized protein n=1 Tax=Candidatus Agrococcus pullicola TaxID=2838429 RepID=A0A9D1YU52_9MICO|nr:hypothetical protein [Candidatus Agrococcus pullicola]